MPASTRVHEASLIAQLIGRLETELMETIFAHNGTNRRCPTETNSEQLNCAAMSSVTHLSHINCSHRTISHTFSSAATNEESWFSAAEATSDALSQLMTDSAWHKLSQKSRNFLRSIIANASALVSSDDYTTVLDELVLLLPVPPHDVTLPQSLLCVDCETALFASVSGLLKLASVQHATGSQCFIGHVFYECGHLAAVERFHFRSNWSRVESELKDVCYCHSDSTTQQLYADTIECPLRVFAAISASIEQSHGCTTDDVGRWYSACKQMLSSTNRIMESLVVGSRRTVAAAWQRCVLEIVVYTLLICVQVCFICDLVIFST